MNALFALLLAATLLPACAQMQRNAGSGYSNEGQTVSTSAVRGDRETTRTAYELGKDPNQLTSQDLHDIGNRKKVREMERSLRSQKEREQYSKVLPWLKNDEEKAAFLAIPTIEGRQQFINRQNIWARSEAPKEEMKDLIETQDIAIGMPQDYVRRSWGEPANVEVSGNPIYKNERWRYQRQVSTSQGYRKETRFVYFEAGRVVGWETE